MSDAARRAAERAARTSYGKLLAILVADWRDIAQAEDALAGAFARALQVWQDRGVPANPDAWLLAAARNAMVNRYRHDRMRGEAAAEIVRRTEEREGETSDFPDARLKLLFVCAHPAIDPAARTPLMLQTVLGLDAARIASAFQVSPATMSQRLVRAKARVRETGLRFDVPGPEHLDARLNDVLAAIYVAFGSGWDGEANRQVPQPGLPEEAIFLARVVSDLLPQSPEAMGLLSLMLFAHARRKARRGDGGVFVPLDRQDPELWDRAMVIEAETLLARAAGFERFGRYQCEAAIQSVHAQRAITGRLNLEALELLYGLLAAHYPTVGGQVALASVMRDRGRITQALDRLDAMEPAVTAGYQPYWVLRAHCLRDLGEPAAPAALEALRLTEDPAIRHLLVREFGLDP